MQTFYRTCLIALVIFHFVIVFGNVLAFFVLPFTCWIIDIPGWYSVALVMPIMSIILFLTFNTSPCPLTVWENHLRSRLGMKKIGGFVGYYLIKRKWRKNYRKEATDGLSSATD